MRSNSPVWLVVLLAILFYGVWRLFELRFAAGDVYPPYSSLRADRQGTKALYDSIAGVPQLTPVRSFRPLGRLPAGRQTILYLGVSPHAFEQSSDGDFEELEAQAAGGARLVIGFQPVQTDRKTRGKPGQEARKPEVLTAVQKRWHVGFSHLQKLDTSDRKSTSLFFISPDPSWRGTLSILERKFGAGTIVLVAQPYPLSNEGLQTDRQPKLIAWMLGGNRRIVFDESHLGVEESGTVAGLARKYRLEGVFAALLVLAGLFLWRNAVSFLPPIASAGDADQMLTPAKDAASGLVNLLRRNIAPAELLRACVTQWERDCAGSCEPGKRERIRALAALSGNPAEVYRKIQRTLSREPRKE